MDFNDKAYELWVNQQFIHQDCSNQLVRTHKIAIKETNYLPILGQNHQYYVLLLKDPPTNFQPSMDRVC